MVKFERVDVIEEFKNNENTYGIYWAEINTQRDGVEKKLIIRNEDSFGVVVHPLGGTAKECILEMRDDVAEEFIKYLTGAE
jgi:hypothetical protein